MAQSMERVRAVTQVPAELGRLGLRASSWSGRQVAQTALRTLGVIRGLTVGDDHLVRHLAATLPLSEAQLGARDMARGLAVDDTELTGLGSREITRAVALVGDPEVSDEVRGKVIDIATRQQVNPLAAPLVRPELADEAHGIMVRFGQLDRHTDG